MQNSMAVAVANLPVEPRGEGDCEPKNQTVGERDDPPGMEEVRAEAVVAAWSKLAAARPD